MIERTVLVVAYYFPPLGLSGVQRTLKFVKYLRDYGWKVIVLTTSPADYYAFDDSLLEECNDDGIIIYRTEAGNPKPAKQKKFPSYTLQKIGRAALQTIYQPDSCIKWKKHAVALGEQILEEHNINAIFSTAPPFTDFLVADELAVKYHKPYIIDYRDSWVDNPFHFYATPFHKNYSIKLEKRVLTRAEKIIVTTRHSKELLLRRYKFLSHNDIKIISHGFDPEDFAPKSELSIDKSKFVITHSGLFQDDRTPKYFFKAMEAFLKKRPDAKSHFEARFIGLMRKPHEKLIKKYKLEENVNLVGYLSHKEAVKQLQESDVLWFMLNDTIRSPGKLYEYFGARKTMLACSPDGIIRKTALDSEAAFATGPKDVKAIENALENLYSLWKAGKLPIPSESFVEQYNRKFLTGELARELGLCADM
jgi:glycosyltransferase involved in cell wall biosynthesis